MNAQSQTSSRKGWLRAIRENVTRPRDHRNENRVNLWAFGWMISLVVCGLLSQTGQIAEPFGWLLLPIPFIPGYFLVRSYLTFLREADELLRQIQFEAMAIGFGIAFVAGPSMLLLTPPGPWWGLVPLLAMCLGYCVRIVIAGREAAKEAEQ